MAGGRMLPAGKGPGPGLDQHQVRTWHSFHRHTVLSMCAQALPAIAAARPAQPAPEATAGTAGAARSLARHRETPRQRR